MTATAAPTVSRSVDIAASPQVVYDLVTNLITLTDIAAETVAMSWKKGTSAAPGNVFSGTNRNGARRWTTKCTVTIADPGAVFEFEVIHPLPPVPVSRWRYDIVATDSGCRVTESTWDQRPGWFRKPAELFTGVHDRSGDNGRNIEATLERLRDRAEAR